jgi:hypothetical protein
MKMSWTEWKEYEEKRRKLFKENGVIDLAHYRAKARWTNPSIPDEEIKGIRFEWDKERKEFVKAD